MLRTLMKSKLHRATVTAADLHYMGSITLDRDLMEAADLLEHERVQVVDVDNGARLETYVIAGERGSGTVCLNGAAARLVQPGDTVIVISYATYSDAEAREHVPTVVFCDETNRPSVAGPEQANTTLEDILSASPWRSLRDRHTLHSGESPRSRSAIPGSGSGRPPGRA